MSRFERRETPPQFEDYRQYRPFLRRDFSYRCAYCERAEAILGGDESFEIDHHRPAAKFPEFVGHYPNLYYSCGRCNRHKSNTWPSGGLIAVGFRFADPCQEDMYSEHLQEMPDGQLRPLTNCGSYSCEHIRLNRPALLRWRQEKRRMAEQLRALDHILAAAERDPGARDLVAAIKSLIAQERERLSL